MTRVARHGSLVVCLAWAACAAPDAERLDQGLEPGPSAPHREHPDEGKIVRAIAVAGCDSPEAFVGYLKNIRIGEPLSSTALAEELRGLWSEHRLMVTQVYTEDVLGGGVRVCFDVDDGSAVESRDSGGALGLRDARSQPADWGLGEPVLVEEKQDGRVVYYFSLSSPR